MCKFKITHFVNSWSIHCVLPENIHTSAKGVFFYCNPPPPNTHPLSKFQLCFSFIISFEKFAFRITTPLEFPIITFRGESGYFFKLHIFNQYVLKTILQVDIIPAFKMFPEFIECRFYDLNIHVLLIILITVHACRDHKVCVFPWVTCPLLDLFLFICLFVFPVRIR